MEIIKILLYLSLFISLLILAIFAVRYLVRRGDLTPAAFQKVVLLVLVPKERTFKDEDRQDNKELIQSQISQTEELFASIGGLRAQRGLKALIFGREDHISFEIVADRGSISFYVVVPRYLQRYVEQQIHAQYPEAHIEIVADYNIFKPQCVVLGKYLRLSRSFILPIKTYRKMDSDPLDVLTNTLSRLGENDGAAIQMVVRSAKGSWHSKSFKVAREMQEGKKLSEALKAAGLGVGKVADAVFRGAKDVLKAGYVVSNDKNTNSLGEDKYHLSPMEEETVKAIEEKNSKAGLDVNLRVIVSSDSKEKAKMYLENIVNAFSQYNIYQYGNTFTKGDSRKQNKIIRNFIYRNFSRGRKFILNIEECASIYHFPLPTTETPNIRWLTARKAPAPSNVPREGLLLGYNEYRGVKTDIHILPKDRQRHMYIIGMTGTGKSTLMEELAKQDIEAGRGVCVVDPHGQLIENILPCIPRSRAEDVIIFNPADIERPVGLNMLEADTPEEADFAVQEMISIFYKLVTDPAMIGPMFEHNMRNAMLTLMADKENPGTLVEIPRIFTDKEFQKYKLQFVTDPMVRAFWEKEMAQTSDFHKSEMLGYLISKVGRFVENEMVRNIIGQPHSGFDFREVMDHKKILLINLSKGKVGEVNSNLLGLIAVSKLQMAALSRANIPEEQRHDFYLYIDEFQNFVTDSIATILAEARKYRLNLIIAHQYIGQLVKDNDTSIKDAVFGNAGNMISFRIGAEDAEYMAKQFAPVFGEFDLLNIEKFNAYVRLLINNTAARPFNMTTYPPKAGNPEIVDQIIQLSRLKYGRDRALISEEILRRSKLAETVKESTVEVSESSL